LFDNLSLRKTPISLAGFNSF